MAEPTKAQLRARVAALEKALRRSDAKTAEAVEQQSATAEILRAISRAPIDLQTVFQVIAENAVTLCHGLLGGVYLVKDETVHLVASHGFGDVLDHWKNLFPRALSDSVAFAKVVRTGELEHITDYARPGQMSEAGWRASVAVGAKSAVLMPLKLGGAVVGLVGVARREKKPFSESQLALLRAFADQAVIAIENVRLFTELEARNRDLTATSDILQVISSSPTDATPVFNTIADSAARLCDAFDVVMFERDGDRLRLVAHHGPILVQPTLPLGRGTSNGRAVVDGRIVHVLDMQSEDVEFPEGSANARWAGYRTVLCVPLMKDGTAIGTIQLRRREAQFFTERQVSLLETFADQAVIAIENVRLFTELEERNQDLTATSEVLRVISRSPTDAQPVFEAIVDSAARLTGGQIAAVFRFDGELVHYLAGFSPLPGGVEEFKRFFPRPLTPGSSQARAIRQRSVVAVPDVERDESMPATVRERLRLVGIRSLLQVPMIRDDVASGVIAVGRTEPIPFTERQVELIRTFADQAVIAIENVRLFTELQASNRELTTALDTQTATGEILRVISRSSTDVRPVFQAIVDSAQRLLHGNSSVMSRINGDRIELAAYTRAGETADALLESFFPIPLHPTGPDTRPIREGVIGGRAPYNVADMETDPRVGDRGRTNARARGYRSQLVVPMLRRDEVIGTIAVTRPGTGEFAADEIALLQTFADQAVIAIENARLLSELQTRTRELEVASQHKSEFLASMSHELRTPLNAVIGFSDVLLQGMFGETNEKQTEYLRDILASGQHLLSLINDILDLSKIEAGRMDLDVAAFDLPTAIDDALLLMRERAGRRGITLERHVDERLGEIHADQRKVKQVLLNLLSNAVKFTPEGGRIDVRSALSDGMAEISVTDTGVGIAAEDHDAVFEEFRQVGKADKKAEGTGLGLALCRKFVELHGGRIWVKSELGQGSTLTFTLPRRR